jgi:hypothetical protein
VALDDSVEAIRPWVEAADPPLTSVVVALDADHLLAEAYGITNVPSTVWLDEDGAIAKPPTITPGDNSFREFTQIDAEAHHEALRRWVHHGELPDATGAEVAPRLPTEDEQRARAERRLASWLHRHGHEAAATTHYERAVALAPLDWTISRGSMPAQGKDPFGDDFFELWQQWDAAGRPDYVGLDRGGAEGGADPADEGPAPG